MSVPSASGEPKIESVKHPDTGEEMYAIAGSYPKYFHNLLFETEEIAEEAKSEAEEVINTRERISTRERPEERSKFFSAYLEKGSLSDFAVIRE
jgi:hypothetical protein